MFPETQPEVSVAPMRGSYDPFLLKYDSAGNLLWSRQFGSAQTEQGVYVTTDHQNNVYVAGHTYGNIGGTNAGGMDAFVIRMDSSGNTVWSRQLGTSADDPVDAICTDGSGNVYIGGRTGGNLAGMNAGPGDGYFAKYDSSGNLLLTRQFGSSQDDGVNSLAVDASGNLYVGGGTDGSVGGATHGSADAYRINGLSKLTGAQRAKIEDALDGPPEDQGAGVPAKPPRGPSLGEAARNK